MGYMHIKNLYADQDILMLKEVFALEKIHGTSAHISWDGTQLTFFSGGQKHSNFVALFDAESIKTKLIELGFNTDDRKVTVYGEAYGGKEQGMSATYGKELKFIVFDVQIGDCWLNVPKAEGFAISLGLEFVHFKRISTDLEAIDAERDADSWQAIRNGVGEGKKREGVVLRPIIELTRNNGSRLMSKHKRDEFKETKSPRSVVDPAKMKILEDATAIAEEWVTPMRLQHVLDKLPGHSIEKMREVIAAMTEDVLREGEGEIVVNDVVKKAIGKRTALEYKQYLNGKLKEADSI